MTKSNSLRFILISFCLIGGLRTWAQTASTAAAPITLRVDSPAVKFSPGNWAGDTGRGGSAYRVTWTSGAYCIFDWTTTSDNPTAELAITNKTDNASRISYFMDGNFVDSVEVHPSGTIPIQGLTGSGDHELIVYASFSNQSGRWNRDNAFTVAGLKLDAQSKPRRAPGRRPWVEIIGDSITEGVGVPSQLDDYSFLVGQGLMEAGYDYCVSACGFSGWIRPGDGTGDVPAYYFISQSNQGAGGSYDDTRSRWNKIDAYTSLLDNAGHLSGYGGTGQEPSAILFNYIVNETLSNASVSDTQASITQSLAALRKAAPRTWIIVLIPPGLYSKKIYSGGAPYIAALDAGVKAYRAANPQDARTLEVSLGADMSNTLAEGAYGGGVHFGVKGHALITPRILAILLAHLSESRF